METLSHRTAQQEFAAWFTGAADQAAVFWSQPLDWDEPRCVDQLLDRLVAEINGRWNGSSDTFSAFGRAVLSDVVTIERRVHSAAALLVIAFVRFLISGACARHALRNGRPNSAFNWMLCALCDRPYMDVETGTPVQIDVFCDRPASFLTQAPEGIREVAWLPVLHWFEDLYYAGWKHSLHHNLGEQLLPEARRLLAAVIRLGERDLLEAAVAAAAQLAFWLNQTEAPEAEEIARLLEHVFETTSNPPGARKAAGMALSTRLGFHTQVSPSRWADRVIREFREDLNPYELVQVIVNSPRATTERYSELLASVEAVAKRTADDVQDDPGEMAFRHTQVFESIVPAIADLFTAGRCSDAVELAAAWHGTPAELRRRSPVLGIAPTHEKGVLLAADGKSKLVERDTEVAMNRMTDALNDAFDLSIVLRNGRELPRAVAGRRGRAGREDELAAATAEYYALDSLSEFVRDIPVTPTAVFQPFSELTPFQPLSRSVLGTCWPLMTSFQEPYPDRPLRHALIWSCGSILGEFEANSTAAFLSAHGVRCEMLIEQALTRDEFLRLYADDRFDVLYLTGHGTYDSREPLGAAIYLDPDGTHTVSVADMLRHPIRGETRRLLILNICLGGTVLVTAAPARLGMGAMLAGASQAVIAHLAEVSTFVAPLFGVLTILGLHRTGHFFPAFEFAIDALRKEHQETLQLLRAAAPQCEGLIERLGNSSPGVDPGDIRTWGTPVFYE